MEFSIHGIPIFIGEGIPLIAPRHRTAKLRVMAFKKYPDGEVRLRYAVKKVVASGGYHLSAI